MISYIKTRLAVAVPVVVGVSILVFVSLYLLPGDPVQALAGLTTAIRHGVSSFVTHHDVDEAVRTARDAASRRMTDLAEELDEAGRTRSGT